MGKNNQQNGDMDSPLPVDCRPADPALSVPAARQTAIGETASPAIDLNPSHTEIDTLTNRSRNRPALAIIWGVFLPRQFAFEIGELLMRQFVFALGAVTLLTNSVALGRPIERYTYQRLFKEADLVVIAKAIESKQTADELFKGEKEYVGYNTEFEINHVLKGVARGETIKLLHFKYVEPGELQIRINAPHLIDVRVGPKSETEPEEEFVSMSNSETPEYMLFLKRMLDGRYEPVSGQVDPVMSIRKVSAPPEVEKQKIPR